MRTPGPLHRTSVTAVQDLGPGGFGGFGPRGRFPAHGSLGHSSVEARCFAEVAPGVARSCPTRHDRARLRPIPRGKTGALDPDWLTRHDRSPRSRLAHPARTESEPADSSTARLHPQHGRVVDDSAFRPANSGFCRTPPIDWTREVPPREGRAPRPSRRSRPAARPGKSCGSPGPANPAGGRSPTPRPTDTRDRLGNPAHPHPPAPPRVEPPIKLPRSTAGPPGAGPGPAPAAGTPPPPGAACPARSSTG